jgi:hypothetical protein
VGEGVKSCPRAGCGKSACPVRKNHLAREYWSRWRSRATPKTSSAMDSPFLQSTSQQPVDHVTDDPVYRATSISAGDLDHINANIMPLSGPEHFD